MGKYLKLTLIVIATALAVLFVFLKKGAHSFLFAYILNFALMLAVSSYTNIFKPQLRSNYYNSKNWEANGTIYKWFGINLFRKLLVLIGWEKIIKAAYPVKKNLDAIKQREYSTRQSEFSHLVIFIIVLVVNIVVAINYGLGKSLSLLILNIIFNVYPVMLQRFNRPRLQKVLAAQR